MSKLILMTGHIGSGKTTYAKYLAKKKGYRYLGIDQAYALLNGDEKCRENKFDVWQFFFHQIKIAEELHQNIIIDTNAPTPLDRCEFLDWFTGFDEYHLVWIDASHNQCLENNKKRERKVPEEHMKNIFSFFVNPQINEDKYARKHWNSMTRIKSNKNNTFSIDKEWSWQNK